MKQFSKLRKHFFTLYLILSALFLISGKGILFRESPDAEKEVPDPPFSLTAGDGAGLILKSYESNTVLDGFLVFTEIKLKFYNPENRQREGRFRITLPEKAHLARFAMQIGGKWQEGEVVEKEKAVRAYEDFLHRKQDPALLESDAGNEFSARIFPIPAKGDKELIVSYSSVLDSEPARYSIPLIGLPEMEEFKVTVLYDEKEFVQGESGKKNDDGSTAERKVFSVRKKNYRPEKNYSFTQKPKGNTYMKNGRLFAARFVPFRESSSEKFSSDSAVFLIDTSASAAPGFSQNIKSLREIISKSNLKEIYIYGFDNKLTYYGSSASDLDRLAQTVPLGSSGLHSALSELKKKDELKNSRLILVSDAVATSGTLEKSKIADAVKSAQWVSRLDVIVPGAYRDEALISELIRSGRINGTQVGLAEGTDEILKRLSSKVHSGNRLSLAGAKWVYPENIESVQAGDPVTVYGELNGTDTDIPKELLWNGKSIGTFTLLDAEELLLEREVTAARIQRLISLSETEQNEDASKGYQLQARELSIKHRIQSPYTSFLVLETEADYERFQISRNSITDIMTVGPAGIDVINRKNSKLYEFLDNVNRKEPVKNSAPERDRLSKKKEKKEEIRIADALEGDADEDDAEESISKADLGKSSKDQPADPAKIQEADKSPGRLSDTAGPAKSPDKGGADSKVSGETSVPPPSERPKTAVSSDEKPEQVRSAERERRRPISETTAVSRPRPDPEPEEKREKVEPYTGNRKKFQNLIDKRDYKQALQFALDWRTGNLQDTLALTALGDAFLKNGNRKDAVRAYSSLIDYFPKRADIRRWAGEKLLSMGEYEEASDTLRHALIQRPDHPSTYHLLASAYIKGGKYAEAASVILKGISFKFDSRFSSVHDILYDDLDLAYSLALKNGSRDMEYFEKIKTEYKLKVLKKEIRFILVWETDANDVDFHIYDRKGNHAWYSSKQLESGGELYADLTGGYGPECFRIINPSAFPYRLEAHYYSRGPMGFGMGAVQIIRYDGEKELELETRDFVIMNDGAYLDLGKVKE